VPRRRIKQFFHSAKQLLVHSAQRAIDQQTTVHTKFDDTTEPTQAEDDLAIMQQQRAEHDARLQQQHADAVLDLALKERQAAPTSALFINEGTPARPQDTV
jgi:hypothetical protein